MKDVMDLGSTHASRCIRGLRRRSVRHDDEYLNVVADEMESVFQIMYTARRALMVLEGSKLSSHQQRVVEIGLNVPAHPGRQGQVG